MELDQERQVKSTNSGTAPMRFHQDPDPPFSVLLKKLKTAALKLA
jgi:hypothetical protein